MSFVYFVWS